MLWVLGFLVGFPGFHRLYLKKYNLGTGLRFIPGLGHMIAFVDLLILPSQVREYNTRAKYHAVLSRDGKLDTRLAEPWKKGPKETMERVILRTAKKNNGVVTPGEVALEGNISIQEAKKNLDELTAKGFSELRVKKSGVVVYAFPEFMDHGEDEALLDL